MRAFQIYKMYSGFTLVEMFITVSVLAILYSIGAPAFQRIISDIRMTGQANDFTGSVLLARSEAIKRGKSVTLCQSSNGTACTNTNWDQGWIIFVDNSNLGVVDAGETIIKVYSALKGGHTLVGTDDITFNANGQTSSTPITLTLCRSDGKVTNRVLTIAAYSGRVQVSKNYAATGNVGSCP